MKIKVILIAAMFLFAFSGVALAQATTSADNTIANFSNNKITIDSVKADLSSKYVAGALTKSDLRKVITAAYNHNKLKRADLRFILGQTYKDGKLTRADLKWILVQAYNNNELTRDDLRFLIAEAYKAGELTGADIKFLTTEAYKAGELKRSDIAWLITHAYNAGELTRDDMKWLIAEAYKAGELNREDLREIVVAAYKAGEFTRDDMKWVLIQMYKNSELTREDLRVVITAAYNHGQLTRADIKWLLTQAYAAGELTKDDVTWILREAYKRGELRKTDVVWILNEAYKAGELKQTDISEADVTGIAVETQPAAVPSVETISEPNADTAATATTAKTFDDSKTAAPAESVIKTKQAWMLYKYALIPTEKHRVGMEALIGYVESIGKGSSTLVTLKDQFISLRDQLQSAAEKNDYSGGKTIISQMKDVVSNFRAETKTLVAGNETAAKAALNAALEQNSDYFDSLVTEARESKKDRNLEFFDLANARAQGRIDKAKTNGADVTALQAKLDEIKELRSDLIDAMSAGIESCKGEGLGKCNTTESQAYVALKEQIESKYKELVELAKSVGQSQKISNAITKAREIIANGEKTLNAAAARGTDVSAYRASLTEITGLVNSAETKYKSGDFSGAAEDLKQAQEKFNALKNSIPKRGTQ